MVVTQNRNLITDAAGLDAAAARGRDSLYPARPKIVVGMSSCGLAAGAGELYAELEKSIAVGRHDVALAKTGCIGFCQQEPLVDVCLPGLARVVMRRVDLKDLPAILEGAARGEIKPAKGLAWFEQPVPDSFGMEQAAAARPFNGLPHLMDLAFYKKQRRIALRNCGLIDPLSIDEYIARGGYRALHAALTSMSPDGVIGEVEKAGLRGRGGAGFPTAAKWRICREQPGADKFIICNGDEGDPGAFMDRSVMEGDPHNVIEGMILGAFAIGASRGYLYVRGEYPLAIKNLTAAIEQARVAGLLGTDIFGAGFEFDLGIVRGAGAFVCGEETALIASIEGDIGSPRPRPPFPAQSGLWGKPTNINNVETWANVPAIIQHGGERFAATGTDRSKGTKVFSLVGKVKNTGLVEVPMGVTLREIVFDIGGGIAKKREFKAVQTGGPSGGCIPAEHLDLPIDYERLREVGAMMGSGGLIVADERTCMVDVARYFLQFLMDESCGKCTPCREGVFQMHAILARICEGEASNEDLALLESLASYVKDSSLCQLGGTAPNPVLSTLTHFRGEYEAHVNEKRCPAGVCKKLVQFRIKADACTGCAQCVKACPTGAIKGERKQPHVIEQGGCITCGVCYDTCMFNAIAPLPSGPLPSGPMPRSSS